MKFRDILPEVTFVAVFFVGGGLGLALALDGTGTAPVAPPVVVLREPRPEPPGAATYLGTFDHRDYGATFAHRLDTADGSFLIVSRGQHVAVTKIK